MTSLHWITTTASCIAILLLTGCRYEERLKVEAPDVYGDTLTIAKDSAWKPIPKFGKGKVKNVILLILDGVSFNQIIATRYRYYGINGRLNMERFPYVALVNTHSSDTSLITDSGAAATALATGAKTLNGMIGVTPEGQTRENLVTLFQRMGKSTAILSYGSLNGATPAAFLSHTRSRENKAEISQQIIHSGADYLFGDKIDFPIGQDLNGYQLWKNNLPDAKIGMREKQLVLFDSLVNEQMSLRNSRPVLTPSAPSLSDAVKSALGHVSRNKNGFFMMIEEDWTDSWGHTNRADLLTWHVKNADDALIPVLDYAISNKQTLVLVTADHETGGMTIPWMSKSLDLFKTRFSTPEHTALPVPIYSFGPGSENFYGVLDNTDLFNIMTSLIK